MEILLLHGDVCVVTSSYHVRVEFPFLFVSYHLYHIKNAKEAVTSMGLSVEVEYITDMQKVMEYGVMSMPALVVNEKVVAMGKVLKSADVVALLHKLGF